MKTVLADIGGTHIRLGLLSGDDILHTVKYPVAQYSSLIDALAAYTHDIEVDTHRVAIATAAWPREDGKWCFAHPDRWEICPRELSQSGWSLALIGNDFEVSAQGVVAMPRQDHVLLKQSHDPYGCRSIVMGPGTGLGLAYVEVKGDDCAVTATLGGHMLCPATTAEHCELLELVNRVRANERSIVAEDIISGPGLSRLYQAIKIQRGEGTEHDEADVLADYDAGKTGNAFDATLKMFHEFLGLFANQAIVFGHAYAGLYLDGGLIHHLLKRDLFQKETFLSAMIQRPVPIVREKLEAVPIYAVTDPYVSLRGLQRALKPVKTGNA